MANEVVIGNLADDKRDDCLKYNNTGNGTVNIATPINGDFVVRFEYTPNDVIRQQAPWLNRNGDDVSFEIKNGIIKFGYYTGTLVYIHIPIVKGEKIGVVGSRIGSVYTLTVNGVTVTMDDSTPVSQVGGGQHFYGGAPFGTGRYCDGVLYSLEVEGFYIYNLSGQFGNASVLDSSGQGNNGTLVGAQWWKVNVDQVFATPLLYRSQLPSTPVEVQHVTYTDKTQPYYPTGDAFWGLYTPTWLTVASLGGNVYLLRQSGLNYSLSMGL